MGLAEDATPLDSAFTDSAAQVAAIPAADSAVTDSSNLALVAVPVDSANLDSAAIVGASIPLDSATADSMALALAMPLDTMATDTVLPEPLPIATDTVPNGRKTLDDFGIYSGVEYEIGGIQVTGGGDVDPNVIILLSGLQVGDKITLPGDQTAQAIKKLWKQKLFEDISIELVSKVGNLVFLNIKLVELPKLSKFYIVGVPKNKREKIREEIDLKRGMVVTDNLLNNTEKKIEDYYIEKGYLNAESHVIPEIDTMETFARTLRVEVDPGPRVKIQTIRLVGVNKMKQGKVYKALKETRQTSILNIFKTSKFIRENFEEDKKAIIALYNKEGFRDARIVSDSIWKISPSRIGLQIVIDEGPKYYFGKITWLGNTKYNNEILDKILRIKEGDVYNQAELAERLFADPNGGDVSSLYLDNGYLFFNLNPVETRIHGDSIDVELRIREGRQATISKVTIVGNDRTNDHVIMRELRTKPGELFRRSDIQRSMRDLSQLGYFDPEKLDVKPVPNPETGTVDIEYSVTERSTSQLELQGGWGGGTLVGTLGLNFNNFSARNIFNAKAWKPLPTGDGQTISLRAQTNGSFFQSYSLSFTEPWLGGKKPNSLTVSLYHNIQTLAPPPGSTSRQRLDITGVTVGLGRRLKWPDDYFTLYQAIEVQNFKTSNYNSLFADNRELSAALSNTNMINLNYKFVLTRNSTDVPIFPTRGSIISLSLELTPPYSLLNPRDFENLLPGQKYRYIEYYKWKFNFAWFSEIRKKLVLKTAAEFGLLGYYNEQIGYPPFERFYLGGDGLQNFQLDGREIIQLRGYPNFSITPPGGGTVYNKFTAELRFLITANPTAQIFVLAFAEGGNNYATFDDFQPFNLRRSAGLGVRVFMPMFGMLGLDFGYGFDAITNQKWQTHFIFGQQY